MGKKPVIPTLYLFDNVFYPHTIIPLSLSDEPSKRLIKQSYEENSPIALITLTNETKGIATQGIVHSLTEKEDGRFMAVVRGVKRIKLSQMVQQIPYPVYEFIAYEDFKDTRFINDNALLRLHEMFEEWVVKNISNIEDRNIFLKEINHPQTIINHISLFLVTDLKLKLIMLESQHLAERVNILDSLLNENRSPFESKSIENAIKDFEHIEDELSRKLSS